MHSSHSPLRIAVSVALLLLMPLAVAVAVTVPVSVLVLLALLPGMMPHVLLLTLPLLLTPLRHELIKCRQAGLLRLHLQVYRYAEWYWRLLAPTARWSLPAGPTATACWCVLCVSVCERERRSTCRRTAATPGRHQVSLPCLYLQAQTVEGETPVKQCCVQLNGDETPAFPQHMSCAAAACSCQGQACPLQHPQVQSVSRPASLK